MKRYLLLLMTLVLAGCAHDNYSVTAGGPGSADHLSDDLRTCKQQAIDAYFAAQRQQQHNGAIIGGVLGGAIGGAIGGAVDASNNPPETMKYTDIDPMIERCMQGKGYVGTSEN